MATNFSLHEEDYIDIILTSDNFIPCSSSIDFEFQNPLNPCRSFPADELFCNGKLLPLRPRKTSREISHPSPDLNPINEDLYYTITFLKNCDSRNCPDDISQWAPCPDDDDDDEDDGFFEWSSDELNGFVDMKPCKKLSWIDKVMFILGRRIKASTAYLKCLFLKAACSGEATLDAVMAPSSEESSGNKTVKKKTSSVCTALACAKKGRAAGSAHLRSLSSVMQRASSTSSSCSSGGSLSCSSDGRFFRSNNGNEDDDDDDESEVSVDAAIAYCKKTLKIVNSSLDNDFDEDDVFFSLII